MEECRKCRFWKPSQKNEEAGACRRYPPARDMDFRVDAALDDFTTHGAAFDRRAWQHPVTHSGDWCGEWKNNA